MNYVYFVNIVYWIILYLKYKFWKKEKKNILMIFCIKNEDIKEVILKKKFILKLLINCI